MKISVKILEVQLLTSASLDLLLGGIVLMVLQHCMSVSPAVFQYAIVRLVPLLNMAV